MPEGVQCPECTQSTLETVAAPMTRATAQSLTRRGARGSGAASGARPFLFGEIGPLTGHIQLTLGGKISAGRQEMGNPERSAED